MKTQYDSHIQRTMIIYFLLICLASLLIVMEFIVDIQRQGLRSELTQNFEKLSRNQINSEEAFRPMQQIRNKAVLMVALLLVVVVIVLAMFIKNITEPLQHMIEASKKMAKGDLSQTINIHTRNELAEMGDAVNEITSNLQEMILLSKDLCDAAGRFVDEVSDAVDNRQAGGEDGTRLKGDMELLKTKINLLNSIILNCKFYNIKR
ncbi:MAG: HAMP domain-containing protein [Desulfobacteraceae bacterium]|nr:HAMP domain-containing protein [Desulfobacteraceae bacterium]